MRLSLLASQGVRGAERALALASDPGKFLSMVQIGITLVGVLSAAFSGATLGERLTRWLIELGLSQGLADIVVTVITHATLTRISHTTMRWTRLGTNFGLVAISELDFRGGYGQGLAAGESEARCARHAGKSGRAEPLWAHDRR